MRYESKNEKKVKPTTFKAISHLVIMIVLLTIGVGFLKLRVELIILICASIASIISIKLGYTW
ncbi:hypothetical protein [Anaerococcus hydrogenalis]|uniref:hypothetical protein n=1 Tax=Anaerococcus hydrogenalis TaxID=33029 RepID=UPI002903DA71|nr:hypothetical protein [Anaerococcus hydrogenalis]MDU1316753.1 hypothetical protein [Anaerococcus hydrogenalis]